MAKTGQRDGPNAAKVWALVDAFSAYTGKPGKYEGSGNTNKTSNSHGFISTPEITIKKKPPTQSELFSFGGSSTAGVSPILADNETWPWITIKKVENTISKKNIEFINAALAGYTSLNHTAGYGVDLDFIPQI